MFLPELIDPANQGGSDTRTPFFFSFDLPYSDPLLKPIWTSRRHSVTYLLQKPLARSASIVQNGPARSQITISDVDL